MVNDRQTIQNLDEIKVLIKCSLILIQAYVAHYRIHQNVFKKHFGKQKFADAKTHFKTLMLKLIPERMEIALETIMEFLRNEQLWKVEFICCKIIQLLLSCHAPVEIVIEKMIDYVKELLHKHNVKETRHVLCTFHDILHPEYLKNISEIQPIRVLKLYHDSFKMNPNSDYCVIKTGLELCLIKLFQFLEINQITKMLPIMLKLTLDSNLNQDAMINFGCTIKHVLSRLQENTFLENLQPNIFDYILNEITSDDETKSYLACRFFSKLLDYNNNYDQFMIPVIFFKDTSYNIKIRLFSIDDKMLIEKYRNLIEDSLVFAIKNYSYNRNNLDAIYNVICLLIVSMPCGFMVAVIICMLIHVQKFAINESPILDPVHVNYLHSMIASIMTLICWVHRPSSLTKYIHNVVNLRYDKAPHLNPPLKKIYKYAQHHILWHKPELYFDSWELRYCLWKCYRLGEELLPNVMPTEIIENFDLNRQRSWKKILGIPSKSNIYKMSQQNYFK